MGPSDIVIALITTLGVGAVAYWVGLRHAKLPSPEGWLRSLHESWLAGVDARKDALIVVNSAGVIDRANRIAETWFDAARWELAGKSFIALFRETDRDALDEFIRELKRAPGSIRSIEVRVDRTDVEAWVELRIASLDDDPVVRGLLVCVTDAREQRQRLELLEREHAAMRTIFDSVPMSMYLKDVEGLYTASNRAYNELVGARNELDLIGKHTREVLPSGLAALKESHERRAVATGDAVLDDPRTHEFGPDDERWFQTTTVPIKDLHGEVTGILGITSDVTERKQVERLLAEQAAQDVLTGLPNRRSLMERLSETIELSRSSGKGLAVVFCDLDFFKSINDLHGHEFGDQLLRALAQNIHQRLRPSDWIARFGGDEFVVVCYPLADQDEGVALADDLLQIVRSPIGVNGHSLRIDASIGLAFLHSVHQTADELIRDADAAMYLAKERGRSGVAVFDDESRAAAIRRAGLDRALRSAIELDELFLVYQPKVSLADGGLVGFEALLRWNSAEHGAVPPDIFVPLAEESGQIVALGNWALRRACQQLREWQEMFPHYDDLTLAVNVSMRQLFQDGFHEFTQDVVNRSGIYPSALELEITESAAMSNPQHTIEVLAQLKKTGVRIALDDFGTGYSSLSHLQRLPIDVIKIDRSFVSSVARKKENAEIARLIVALSRALGITSVAEGIETREDLELLKSIGADIGQGFLFSRAMPALEAEEMLRISGSFVVV